MKLKVSIDLNFKIGRFVKRFILADMALFAGWGLLDPIFSLFIIGNIRNATLITIGIATAIYWILKSVFQIPIALWLDKTKSETVVFYTLVGSLALGGVSVILFVLAREPWHLYILQILKAIAFGLYVPSWSLLFSRHLDKGHYSLDWSLDSTSVGLTMGLTGLIGGAVAKWFGYEIIFIVTGLLTLIAAAIAISLPQMVLPEGKKKETPIRDHIPLNTNL